VDADPQTQIRRARLPQRPFQIIPPQPINPLQFFCISPLKPECALGAGGRSAFSPQVLPGQSDKSEITRDIPHETVSLKTYSRLIEISCATKYLR
jgi:hypothetical protein